MKIVISSFDNAIELSDEYTQVLEISDKILFSRISEAFYYLCNGDEAQESILLFEKDTPKDFSKCSLFLASPLLLDVNNKNIQTKLLDLIQRLVLHDPEKNTEITKIYNDFLGKLIASTDGIDLPVDWSSALDWSNFLKYMSPKIDLENSDSIFERLLLYVEVISNLKLASFLILCNFKSFLSNEQLLSLYKTSRYQSIPLFLVESGHAEEILYGERKIWVDEDYVELVF